MLQTAMLIVHHLGRSQSDRIVWLCEELGVPYELKVYAREPSGAANYADYLFWSGCPNILTYLQRVGARPAFQRSRQKSDPDLPPNLT